MTLFKPVPCPCGCKKWIMGPTFACQCSSVDVATRDELIAMQLDAQRYRLMQALMNDSKTIDKVLRFLEHAT